MRRRLLVLAFLGLLTVWQPASSFSRTAVVGGQPVDIHNAPWTVFVVQPDGAAFDVCTGSLLDSLHVLTAGHCLYDEAGQLADPTTMVVLAGISNFNQPLPTDALQLVHVASGRVHPAYVYSTNFVDDQDDVAVLTLATPVAATDVSQPIALAPAGTSTAAGTAGSVTGFGQENPSADPDGTLNHADLTLPDQTTCGPANAVLICAAGPAVTPCEGDSGSALVASTPTPAILGVTDYGEQGCPVGQPEFFANVAAPEIAQFIEGNPSPPTAPRQSTDAALATPLVFDVGTKAVCDPGQWTGTPTFSFTFADETTHEVLQSGASPTYVAVATDVGRTIECVADAQNAGGTGVAEAVAAAAVQPAPTLHVASIVAHRGRVAVLKVVISGGVAGTARLCAYPAALVAARDCLSAQANAAATGLTAALRLTIHKHARLGRTSMLVSALLPDGTRLQAHVGLVVAR